MSFSLLSLGSQMIKDCVDHNFKERNGHCRDRPNVNHFHVSRFRQAETYFFIPDSLLNKMLLPFCIADKERDSHQHCCQVDSDNRLEVFWIDKVSAEGYQNQ